MPSQFIADLNIQSGGNETGLTILLLHGVTRQIADLQPIIDRLPTQFGWLAVDFPGHGKSPPSKGDYKVPDYSAHILRLIEQLPNRPLILFGHSLGAMVAAQVASLSPNRFAGVILEDPPFSTMGSRIKETFFYLQFQGVRDLLWSRPNPEELFQRLRELPVRHPNGLQIVRFCDVRDDASLRNYAKYLSEVDPRVLDPIVSGQWLDGYDLGAIAAKVDCPVQLFQADEKHGGMLTHQDATQYALNAREFMLTRFDGAPHLIHATQADSLALYISSFLKYILRDP
jgi:pimeloyl-ACP methyl ester carboxylesterase